MWLKSQNVNENFDGHGMNRKDEGQREVNVMCINKKTEKKRCMESDI